MERHIFGKEKLIMNEESKLPNKPFRTAYGNVPPKVSLPDTAANGERGHVPPKLPPKPAESNTSPPPVLKKNVLSE
jgi:hypothetical protein